MHLELAHAASLPDNELNRAYDAYLQLLFGLPLWSPEQLHGMRIPWWALEAARHQFSQELSSPGLYLFGVREEPMYMGQTGESLLSRLRGRYTRSRYAQFQIAMAFADVLKTQGYEALPHDVLAWYRRGHRKSRVRLRHAQHYASAGIASVWIALIPCRDKGESKNLESRLISIANAWNRDHSLPDLLNVQHAEPTRSAASPTAISA